jgi:hypothetical protein
MTTPRAWQRDEDGKIALQLKIDELHTIISSLRTVCYNLGPAELETRIGRTQQEIETLLHELLEIADTVDPPIDYDPPPRDATS